MWRTERHLFIKSSLKFVKPLSFVEGVALVRVVRRVHDAAETPDECVNLKIGTTAVDLPGIDLQQES